MWSRHRVDRRHLRSHRHHVEEFAYIWDRPLELALVVPCGILALAAVWIGRRRWRPFDVGLLLVSFALLLSTMRGIVFFSVVSIAVFAGPSTATLRAPPAGPGSDPPSGARRA